MVLTAFLRKEVIMKSFKRIAAGILLAVLLIFSLHSRAEAVADFKACWTEPEDNGTIVLYLSFVGDDIYSVNGKALYSDGALDWAASGTIVIGATEAVASLVLADASPFEVRNEMVVLTIDLATLAMVYEVIETKYIRATTAITSAYESIDLTVVACP